MHKLHYLYYMCDLKATTIREASKADEFKSIYQTVWYAPAAFKKYPRNNFRNESHFNAVILIHLIWNASKIKNMKMITGGQIFFLNY